MRFARAAGRAWDRFWFEPQATSTLALFRIGLGAITFVWGLALLPNFGAFFRTDGIEPAPVIVTWRILGHWHGNVAPYVVCSLLLISALAVTVGFRTRLASVVMFVMLSSLLERSLSIFNSGDGLLRNLAFLLMFMPAGEAFSIDRWRRHHDDVWAAPPAAPWGLRLVQLQISLLYIATVVHKIHAGGWTDGTALSYVWRMEDLVRFHVPGFVIRSVGLSTLVSFLTLSIELMLGVLVWVRSARPLVLGLGVVLHLVIDLTLRIGFFSWTILVTYLAFLSPEVATRVIRSASGWRLRVRRSAVPSP